MPRHLTCPRHAVYYGMTKNQINTERRKYANKIAKRVAKLVGYAGMLPKCDRISKRRGNAVLGGDRFSVPEWIFERHPAYRDYYCIHESLHCLTGLGDGNPLFREEECKVNLKFGHTIVYNRDYPLRLVDKSGFNICDRQGRPIV